MAGAFPNEEFKMLNQLKTDGWYFGELNKFCFPISYKNNEDSINKIVEIQEINKINYLPSIIPLF